MITRRDAVRLLSSAPAAAWFAGAQTSLGLSFAPNLFATSEDDLALLPGAPMSPERLAFIEAFKRDSDGLEKRFEARSYKSEWTMPYRLFRPATNKKVPLVVYLHGSGGMGDDNLKQLGLGNIFGTRVWLLPENQKRNPCFVVVPQTDRGWARYDFSQPGPGPAKEIPGLGDGVRLALEIITALCREFPIDERRIYVTGQSMGGAGTWHITAQRPKLFAAAAAICGSPTLENAKESIATPLWNFHGDADETVPVAISRDRIATLRKAGAHPLSSEYAGIGHNVWEWAYTEPALVKWMFSQRRG